MTKGSNLLHSFLPFRKVQPRPEFSKGSHHALLFRPQVDANRQSLSARFFARLSLSPPPPSDAPATDPPESPSAGVHIDLSAEDDDSLTSQRERLKQRDRAGRMAAEVARLRARMSGLGIAVLPRNPAESAVTSPPAALTSPPAADVTSSSGGVAQALGGGEALENGASPKLEAGAWMVSDRAGKAVPPPGTLTEAARIPSFQGDASSAEGSGIAIPLRDVSSQFSQAERSSNREPEAALLSPASKTRDGEETLESILPRRLSPWAARTNPLYDSEHARGDSPPGPVPPLDGAARAGNAGGSETPNPKALEGEASACDNEVRRRSHVSARDGSHVSPGTPPPERSQSPDLDHERNQRTDPSSEPLILDHTMRNNTPRAPLDARFESPSLAEGIPTIPVAAQKLDREGSPALSSELSFPRLLETGSAPSPRLGSPRVELSDSEDDAEELQPVVVSGGTVRVALKNSEGPTKDGTTIRVAGDEEAVGSEARVSSTDDWEKPKDAVQRAWGRRASDAEAQRVESKAELETDRNVKQLAVAKGHLLSDLASDLSEGTGEREAERTAAAGLERADWTVADASEGGIQKTTPSPGQTEAEGRDKDDWRGVPDAMEAAPSSGSYRGPFALKTVDEHSETVQSDGPGSLPQVQSDGRMQSLVCTTFFAF